MKKLCYLLLFLLVMLIQFVGQRVIAGELEPYSSATKVSELEVTARWCQSLLGKGDADSSRYSADVPFSFICGDRSSREWIRLDNAQLVSETTSNGVTEYLLRWKDPQSELVCEMKLQQFDRFPALEWTVFIRNEGKEDSARIHSFKSLDLTLHRPGTMPIIYRSQGSDSRCDDFRFDGEEMRKSMWTNSRTVRLDSKTNSDFRKALNSSLFDSDNRPSATWLPFVNYQTGSEGLIVGLGWNGCWFAEFAHDGGGNTQISAGMENLNTKLYPGESIRSPLILVLYWSGEMMHAQNLFRRFVLAHHNPQENGKPAYPPICCSSWGGTPTAEHLETIKEIIDRDIPYDCYWIDAGWYGMGTDPCPNVFSGDWGSQVGDWRVNPTRHPNTLKPIAETLAKANKKFLLWFETERNVFGVPSTIEHPEWFLTGGGAPAGPGENVLLNLGNPEALAWITDTISNIITENKITWYREDFNMVPDSYWHSADSPDRIGMTEMRFVEGLYRLWDDLLASHPGLMIDNCASGGRRIELETMKRSIPLWRTDYNCFPHVVPEVVQSHGFGASHWLPANAISPMVKVGDTYGCRSALSSGAVLSPGDFGNAVYDDSAWDWMKQRVADAALVRPYFYGDFYPLTNGNYKPDAWLAFHYFLPEEQEGMILAFRREKSPVLSMTVDLTTIDPQFDWSFEDVDTGESWTVSGKELREKGFEIKIPNPRDTKLLLYKKL